MIWIYMAGVDLFMLATIIHIWRTLKFRAKTVEFMEESVAVMKAQQDMNDILVLEIQKLKGE